ncbi:Fanconi anemia core complex-associated protein 24 isoform 2-T2 [Aulostomus maculatus]
MEPRAAAAGLNAVPPYGHVVAGEKWRNSLLLRGLMGAGVKILFESEPGVADLHLSNRSCILYVSECDIIAGSTYKRKLVRYRNACSSLQELVLVENTHLSEQYFSAVQRFVVFDLGLTLLPVSGQTEASQLIAQLVREPTGSQRGPREPFQEEEFVSATGPTGCGAGAADSRGGPGQSTSAAAALLQHPSALQGHAR